MRIIGTVPGSVLKDGKLYSRRMSPYAKLYTPVWQNALAKLAGDKYHLVNSVNSNYYTTVKSWDQKPDYSYHGTEAHVFGLCFLRQYYRDIMNDPIATAEQIVEWIDWSKSPGWPHTYFGFRTKAELVQALDATLFADRIHTMPLWNVAGKVEYKDIDDILANKIRLFQIPSFEFLYSQLKFGKSISLKLMLKHWSAYGFNPYCGGFDTLARKLLLKRWRGCYDVSGWDKFLPVLDEIYDILQAEGNFTPEDLEEFLWVADNTVNFLLKTVDGNVLLKTYGNASGSGTTTRDNIFGHIIIFAAGLYSAYKAKTGIAPSFELVFEQVVFLYGDDNIYAIDDDFSYMCDPDFLSAHLKLYGLKLKFFFGGLDADLSTLSFLGAHFVEHNGSYYPLYDTQRLATTMLYEPKQLNLGQHISKAFTLMVMSYPSPDFSIFRESYRNLITDPIVQRSSDLTAQAYTFVGLPSDSDIEHFYLGSEASSFSNLVLSFLPGELDNDDLTYYTDTKLEEEEEEEELTPPFSPRVSLENQPDLNMSLVVRQQQPRRRKPRKTVKKAGKPKGPRRVKNNTKRRPRNRTRRSRNGKGGGGASGVGPTMMRSTNKSLVFRVPQRREYIGDILVANQPNYNCVSYSINPGNAVTFPWLSTIATKFEKYKFNRLSFLAEREVSEFNTAGSGGNYIMGVDFDAADPQPGAWQNIADTVPFTSGMGCENLRLVLPPQELKRRTDAYYVRSGPPPPNTDIKTYDIGNLNIATAGIAANVAIAKLYVEYQVDLMIPVQESEQQLAPVNYSVSSYANLAGQSLVSSVRATATYDTVIINSLGLTVAAGSVKLPAGNWWVAGRVLFSPTADTMTVTSCDLYLNGSPINALYSNSSFVAGTIGEFTENFSGYFNSNAGDIFTLSLQGNTHTASNVEAYASFSLQAI